MSNYYYESGDGPLPPPDNGIPMLCRRGRPGRTFWGQSLLSRMEETIRSSKLTSGLAVARKARVSDLEIGTGTIRAFVTGHAHYRTAMTVRPWPETAWQMLIRDLADESAPVLQYACEGIAEAQQRLERDSALILGTESEDEEYYDDSYYYDSGYYRETDYYEDAEKDPHEESIFFSCSCPDASYADCCKHAAALGYVVIEAFDADPGLVLLWRGRHVQRLKREVRAYRAGMAAASARSGSFWTMGEGDVADDSFACLLPSFPDPQIDEALGRLYSRVSGWAGEQLGETAGRVPGAP